MDVVVDANVLFSAAIKDSKTAELLLRLLSDVGALLGVLRRDRAPDARAPAGDARYTVGE